MSLGTGLSIYLPSTVTKIPSPSCRLPGRYSALGSHCRDLTPKLVLLHPPSHWPTQPSFCLHNKGEPKGLLQKWGCCCIILPTPRPHLVPCPQHTPPRAGPPPSLPAHLCCTSVSLTRRKVSQTLSCSFCVQFASLIVPSGW